MTDISRSHATLLFALQHDSGYLEVIRERSTLAYPSAMAPLSTWR